jgi:hypothetical protein
VEAFERELVVDDVLRIVRIDHDEMCTVSFEDLDGLCCGLCGEDGRACVRARCFEVMREMSGRSWTITVNPSRGGAGRDLSRSRSLPPAISCANR